MKLTQASILLGLAQLTGACLLPEERDPDYVRPLQRRQSGRNGKAIGTGDRFDGGASFPRGLGSGDPTDMSTILNVDEVISGLQGLSEEYGFDVFTTPYKTYEGRTIYGAKVGGQGTCDETYRVFFNGAIHARERGSSDNILYLISDLLYAEREGTGLTYGDKTFTNAQVRTALGAGIVFIPLSNPDGVAYDQSSNSCWRKNRNPAASSGSSASVGVDLNRNFDFAWDLSKWASSVRSSVASSSASSEVYHGRSAFSEPETKSIKWVLDTYSNIRWFLDLHSYAGDILYSWGSDTNQVRDTAKNFMNSAYDSIRGITTDSPTSRYGEYIPQEDLDNVSDVAAAMTDAMLDATGRRYVAMQSAELYATSGASDDYSFSRHFADSSLNLVYGYTVEFGFGNNAASCPFYPSDSQYIQNLQETNAGLMQFLLSASQIGLGDAQAC
ncbi:hypothetical protein F4778DRAFT_200589 [Xylariomycetidae sp. FL2044]|nr:hypothetical protein F4778DRAFT_200589 [Xylariomycetidae sp. FL2044]